MPEWLRRWLDSLQELAWWELLLYATIAAFVVQFVVTRVVRTMTRRTKTDLDDRALGAVRTPLFLTVLFVGVDGAVSQLAGPGRLASVTTSVLISIAVLAWMRALTRIADAMLKALARRVDDFRWIEPRSLPLYEIAAKLTIVGGAIYGLLLAWDIDPTAWLASAGILGLAVGFAAKDTLANLFSGIFILADAPYQLGDFIVLDSGERGRVTDIGIRSTRILTRDDIEITIPNAVIANAKIVNETQGPYKKRRVRINVGVAYGSDLEQVRAALLDVAAQCELIDAEPAPSARVRGFGDSAIDFQLRGYIAEPVLHGRVVDRLCTDIYARFVKEGIEIPFPQQVVHWTPPKEVG